MEQKNIGAKVAILIFIFLIAVNYSYFDNLLKNFLSEDKEIIVDRVIDGDTIESNGTSIRLLGINSPEKGEFGYNEAKNFLQNKILNKTVTLKFTNERTDKYGRTLAYVFINSLNINVESVRNGFSNYYFYSGKDEYYNDLFSAWNECIVNGKNLCEKSANVCANCINIINSDNFIMNNCSFSCNITKWVIEGEGRGTFVFENKILYQNQKTGFSLNLTNSGGSIFLRDDSGKLVDWASR